jgi:hypothetical protein
MTDPHRSPWPRRHKPGLGTLDVFRLVTRPRQDSLDSVRLALACAARLSLRTLVAGSAF